MQRKGSILQENFILVKEKIVWKQIGKFSNALSFYVINSVRTPILLLLYST